MDNLSPRITWRKSSYSSSSNDNCVEVATAARTVAVRDSKDPMGPVLAFVPGNWQALSHRVRRAAAESGLSAAQLTRQ